VTGTPPSGLRRLLAGEFGRRGWEWDIAEGGALVEAIVDSGHVDPQQLAQRVSGTYLQRIGAERADLADAIQTAVGGRVPGGEEERLPVTLIFRNDNRYQLNMGAGARIADSQVNVGGTQINVRVDSPRDDVVAGVAELVRAGLRDEWNPDAARELGQVVDARDDVTLEDVESVVKDVVAEESPDPERAKGMLQEIAESGLGGALPVGIVKAVGLAIGAL
jgi:hypothetical protein